MNYELWNADGKVIATGSFDQIAGLLKHHLPDGKYRVVGPDYKIHVITKDGDISPDPDGVALQARHARIYEKLTGKPFVPSGSKLWDDADDKPKADGSDEV